MTKLASRSITWTFLFCPVFIAMAEAPSKSRSAGVDARMIGIEKLHRQDVAATLSGDPNLLADLWTDDAVRLEPGGPAEIGKQVIRVNNEKAKLKNPELKVLNYSSEIKSIRIVDDWAFEWGYFNVSYRDASDGPVKSFRGKLLRVLRQQGGGSWKFARVMWNPAE